MHLTPEFKDVGKANFHAAVGSKNLPDSHELVEKTVKEGKTSGDGLGSLYYGYGTVEKPVKVAVLGTGDEGSVLIGAINPKYIDVKAIADIRPYNQWRAFNGDWYSPTAHGVRCGLFAKYQNEKGWESEADAREAIQVFGDYKDLIEAVKKGDLDIEAVIIGLPLHLHAPAAIAAMNAGLHVLTEKLMGHSVHECKEMARVAKKTGKHLVTGHQRHYNILYAQAVKMLESGLLGDLHYIRAQWHRGNKPGSDSWQQPLPERSKPGDAQAGKLEAELAAWKKKRDSVEDDYEKGKATMQEVTLWRMKAAQKEQQILDRDLDPTEFGYEDKTFTDSAGNKYERPAMEELIRWRLWNRTGGGLMAELGSHQLDASAIFLAAVNGGKKAHPISVDASAARSLFPLDREVDDHVFCLYEYPKPGEYDPNDPVGKFKKVTVQYASINGNGFDDYGETVYGTEGTLVLERETRPFLFKLADTLGATKVVRKKLEDGTIVSSLETAPEVDAADEALGVLGTTGMDISRGYCEEEEHWAYCIRENPEAKDDGPLPHCHPKIALGDAVIALTTNLSAAEGRKIFFKEEWFDIDSDETPEGVKPDISKYDA